MTLRLEVNTTGTTWVDVLGSTNSIQITRSPMNLGTMTANLVDVALDPTTSTTLASGRPVRVQTLTSNGWRSVFTGKISQTKVAYNQGPIAAKRAQIELSAVDAMQVLGTKVEPRSVATTNELRTLLAAAGVSWRVNGTTTAGPTSPQVVGSNSSAFLADQIAITRDTVLGYAWVDADGVLQVYDPGSMPTTTAATYSDTSNASYRSYSDCQVSYDTTDVVDEVLVTFLRYKPVAGSTEEIQYGPYRRSGSTGTNTRTYTIAGATESASAIASYAQGILDRTNSAAVRPVQMSTPIRTTVERDSVVAADLCSRVRVLYGSLDRTVRVNGIEHTITAVTGKASTIDWSTTYTFTVPEAVPESQALSLVPPVAVQNQIESVQTLAAAAQTTADEGVDPAATAERLTGQVITGVEVRTADSGAQWVVGGTGNVQRLQARSGDAEEVEPGGVEIVVGTSTLALTLEAPSLPSTLTPSIDLVQRRSTGVSEVVATANRVLVNAATLDLAGSVGTGSVGTGTFRDSVRSAVRLEDLGVRRGVVTRASAVANTNYTASITFPTGLYSTAPVVSVTAESAAAPQNMVCSARDVTTTGFTVQYRRATDGPITVHWMALPA